MLLYIRADASLGVRADVAYIAARSAGVPLSATIV